MLQALTLIFLGGLKLTGERFTRDERETIRSNGKKRRPWILQPASQHSWDVIDEKGKVVGSVGRAAKNRYVWHVHSSRSRDHSSGWTRKLWQASHAVKAAVA